MPVLFQPCLASPPRGPRVTHIKICGLAAHNSCYRCGSPAPRSCPFSGLMMGSKMASASRVVQVVKPHTPLIRFPDRRDNPKPNVSEVLRSTGLPSHSSISQHSKGSKTPDWPMHQGPPDTADIIKTLPQKYRRKPVSQEEIEFIQRGGPE